jgi:hypothetical protein
MKRSLLGLGGALSVLLLSGVAHAYYSPTSTEAWLQFDAYVDAPMNSLPDVNALNQAGSVERNAATKSVARQVQHLIGVFQSKSLKREFGYLGTLDEDSDHVLFTSAEPTSEEGRIRLKYTFRGKTIFDKTIFGEGQTDVQIPFVKLPREPDQIYKISMSADGRNYCTDETWNDEYDFFYFFDPDKSKCPLKGNTTDVLRVSGVLSKIQNTESTYPEYDRLYSGGIDGVMKIALFYGYINPVDQSRVDTTDDGYTAMKRFESKLAKLGYVQDASGSRDGFRLSDDSQVAGGIDFLHNWYNSDRSVKVQILLADTDDQSADPTFHAYFKDALENSDIVDYDGHIGTPENLLLTMPALSDTRFDPSKYQIFFFDGCTSYPYFKRMYSDAKGGSGNFNLITSGLEESSGTSAANDIAFLQNFLEKKTLSFQTILREMENSSGQSGPYFYGVNGDENNVWHP